MNVLRDLGRMKLRDDFREMTVGEALKAEARALPQGLPQDDVAAPEVSVNEYEGLRTYLLLVPVKVDGKYLRKVTLRLPSQADIDDWGTGEIESARAFLCRLTGLHPAVVKALRWPDSAALYQMFRDVVPDFVAANEG